MAVKVVIVDNDYLIAQCVQSLLSIDADLEVIGVAVNGHEGLKLVGQLQPDVVLLDLQLPDINEIDLLRVMRQDFPNLRVLIFTATKTENVISSAINAGAHGYLSKNVDIDNLILSIKNVVKGQFQTSEDVTLLLERLHPEANSQQEQNKSAQHSYRDSASIRSLMTKRELEVLSLLAEGKSNKLIASQLGLSAKTIKAYVSAILAKLAVDTRLEAVIYAINSELLNHNLNEP